jgi:hypothetical protein
MISARTLGLVGAGGVNQSFVARMPALLARLGPVKGSSLRVSRRIANGFRSGTAVARYADLAACESIWISVPDELLDQTISGLADEISLHGKNVVLCEVLRDSASATELRAAGARVATLNSVPKSGERLFVAEGNAVVVAGLRKRLALDGRKLIELLPGAKSLYWLGIHMGSHMLVPWIEGATRSLRAAGCSRMEATQLVQALGRDVLRGYATAGERVVNPDDARRMRRIVEAELTAITAKDSMLADLFMSAPKRARGERYPVMKAKAG